MSVISDSLYKYHHNIQLAMLFHSVTLFKFGEVSCYTLHVKHFVAKQFCGSKSEDIVTISCVFSSIVADWTISIAPYCTFMEGKSK